MYALTTRHPKVDVLAPIEFGKVQVRGARTANGKSGDSRPLALDLAVHGPVLYVHTEEESWDVVRQMAAASEGLNVSVLEKVKILFTTSGQEILEAAAEVAARYGQVPCVVIDVVNQVDAHLLDNSRVKENGLTSAQLEVHQAELLRALADAGYAVVAYTQGRLVKATARVEGTVTTPGDLFNQAVVGCADTLITFDRFKPFENPALHLEETVTGARGSCTRTRKTFGNVAGAWHVFDRQTGNVFEATRVEMIFDMDPYGFRGHWLSA